MNEHEELYLPAGDYDADMIRQEMAMEAERREMTTARLSRATHDALMERAEEDREEHGSEHSECLDVLAESDVECDGPLADLIGAYHPADGVAAWNGATADYDHHADEIYAGYTDTDGSHVSRGYHVEVERA